MPRSAFVTGAAGFVGRHLVERLDRDGWAVTAFCRPDDPVDLLPAGVTVQLGDLDDAVGLTAAVPEHVDAVFHLAGNASTWSRNRVPQLRDNVTGTAHVIDAALTKNVGRLVYTSSVSAYGYQPGIRLTEQTPSNVATRGDNYGRSKLAAENLLREACAHRGLNAVILNPVNILGPYDLSNWSRQFILPIAASRLRVVPPGSATWISVHDVVGAHVSAVDAGEAGENFLLGGVEASFREVVNEIEHLLGKPLSNRCTSVTAMRALLGLSVTKGVITSTEPELNLAKYRRCVGDLLVDDRRARTALGLEHTPLREQLELTVGWLRDVGLLPRSTSTGGR